MTQVIKQHRRIEDLRGWVRHVATGEHGRAAMNSLEVRVIGTDVARTVNALLPMSIAHTRSTSSTGSSLMSSTLTTSPRNDRNGGCPRERYGKRTRRTRVLEATMQGPEDHTPSVRLLNGLHDQAATTSASNHPRFSRTTGRHGQRHRGLLVVRGCRAGQSRVRCLVGRSVCGCPSRCLGVALSWHAASPGAVARRG
jgi:hypothetical protein